MRKAGALQGEVTKSTHGEEEEREGLGYWKRHGHRSRATICAYGLTPSALLIGFAKKNSLCHALYTHLVLG